MKWLMKEPSRGDMIRVESGTIYHFGIYVSDDEVIQFGLAPSQRTSIPDSEIEVISTDIDRFLCGGFLEVCEFDKKERKKHRSPSDVVAYAKSKLGMRGYNILYNNCEHFANECISGEHISKQAEDVRAFFRNMPIADVYIAVLPDKDLGEPLACSLRQKEIDGISNDRSKREKYYVWKLLEYGLWRSFGLKIADLTFTKDKSGRYFTDKAEFSLSHSKGALAVAVSRAPIGIDIENKNVKIQDGMAKRSMTQSEYALYNSLCDSDRQTCFIKLWTAKEAIFKQAHKDGFIPSDIDTAAIPYISYEKNVGGKPFILSVATGTTERIRIFEDIKL